jgi:hypothetical protein
VSGEAVKDAMHEAGDSVMELKKEHKEYADAKQSENGSSKVTRRWLHTLF